MEDQKITNLLGNTSDKVTRLISLEKHTIITSK